jgi:polyferredoxin
VQLFSAVLFNLNLKGFFAGTIFLGDTKMICVPSLNCYSCPGAVGACPLGSLQSALGEMKFGKLPLYIVGTLIVFGILFGRAICAFLCPFGLIQELLHKIPLPKLRKSKWTRRLSYSKYVILAIFVVALPLYFIFSDGIMVPAFCKYICPAGTLEGGIPLVLLNSRLQGIIGALFNWKIMVLAIIVIASAFIYRFFCRFICPLGAIYSFFNKFAMFGVDVDKEKCVGCGRCVKFCKMDVKRVNDHECIRCGECRQVCARGAIISRTPISYTNTIVKETYHE